MSHPAFLGHFDLVRRCGDSEQLLQPSPNLSPLNETAAKAAVQLAVDSFGRLDVLVNNAGYVRFEPFEQMSAEDFQAVVDTCFYGVVYTTRAAVPVMRKQKNGHIFQVSSRLQI
jgi:NAD(P)-dependent dehydrogenase (short-subunit alcohol dehydrogenase family)